VRRNFVEGPTMDLTNRISRSEIAEQLGVQTQTIAKWERMGTFPPAKEHVSDRVILYDRDEVRMAIESRLATRFKRVPPRRP
jgi:transcriptional regulator with XRE-family HTH domain